MDDEAPKVSVFVDRVRIPCAEIVIRPTVDRMIEIERAGVDRQLIEFVRVEPCVPKEDRIGIFENFNCLADQIAVLPLCRARLGKPDRNRRDPFVRVWLVFFLPFQNRNRAKSEKVVCLSDDRLNNGVVFLLI